MAGCCEAKSLVNEIIISHVGSFTFNVKLQIIEIVKNNQTFLGKKMNNNLVA